MVTRGASWARSQSLRSLSPASNWRRLKCPLANSHPSGDSAMFTVTERMGRAGARENAAGTSVVISRSLNNRAPV
jgi:hypothetical protein